MMFFKNKNVVIISDSGSAKRVLRFLKSPSCASGVAHLPIPEHRAYICVRTRLTPAELACRIKEDVKYFADAWMSDGGIMVSLRSHFLKCFYHM